MTLPPAEVPLNVHIHYRAPALNGLHRESCSNHPGRSEGAAARRSGGAARRPRTEQWEEGKKGRGTNCMLEEEDQIIKRVRE